MLKSLFVYNGRQILSTGFGAGATCLSQQQCIPSALLATLGLS